MGWGLANRETRKLRLLPLGHKHLVSSPGIYAHTGSPNRYTHLYAHGHSPCFADTAGRTAEPSGTGEVVYCPQHCGSSPGLGSRRRFKQGNDAFPSPASRKSALNDSDPPIIWHSTHISFCPLPHPIPGFLTSSSYPTLPRRLSSETDVSSLIQPTRSDN